MGLILDSSVVIAAERRGDAVEKLIEQIIAVTGDQDAALSSVGLTELAHGIYRAQIPEYGSAGRLSLMNYCAIWPSIHIPKQRHCWPQRSTVSSRPGA